MRKAAATKNKQIALERYPFSFISWVHFIFLVGGLKV